jgi:hypothetical protein
MEKKIALTDITAALPRMIRASGRLYMHGTQTLIEDFGAEGEQAVREWLRRWGLWRGRELRKGHMALGLPINMESLCVYWDSAAATMHLLDEWKSKGAWHPCNVRVPVIKREGACPVSEPWRENDFWQWGHVLCDEFHIHFVRGYHPDAVVVIPHCIMKKDDLCDFNFVMPPNAKQPEGIEPYGGQNVLDDWRIDTDLNAAVSGLKRKTRITAARISFLWEILSEAFPEKAEETFAKIIDRWAASRADALQKEKNAQQWGDAPEDLMSNFDHPYGLAWEMEKTVTPQGIDIEVSYCPFAETWAWMGVLPAMAPYCQRCYNGIWSNYDSSFSAEVSRCKTRGDDTCLISLRSQK